MKQRCAAPWCRARADAQHHIVYRQELRRHNGDEKDARNLMPLCWRCHGNHHSRARALPVTALPDSAFEYARELLGGPYAFEYLRRRYKGADGRLDALLTV